MNKLELNPDIMEIFFVRKAEDMKDIIFVGKAEDLKDITSHV